MLSSARRAVPPVRILLVSMHGIAVRRPVNLANVVNIEGHEPGMEGDIRRTNRPGSKIKAIADRHGLPVACSVASASPPVPRLRSRRRSALINGRFRTTALIWTPSFTSVSRTARTAAEHVIRRSWLVAANRRTHTQGAYSCEFLSSTISGFSLAGPSFSDSAVSSASSDVSTLIAPSITASSDNVPKIERSGKARF